MRLLIQGARWVGASIILVVLSGCGSSGVYPVKGKVTVEGKPMAGGGSIIFVPLGTQAGKQAGGNIETDGTYTLTTNSPGDGSLPGEFRVVIVQVTEKEPEATPDGQAPAKGWSLPPAERIPLLYGDQDRSPLKATVEAKNPNELNFDLKRNP
ncbi:MAG: hypothetical protein L0Z62_23115 [Gemmataceae bacterium]|nr:hypothetical protein [Gemmataceae bacterium]